MKLREISNTTTVEVIENATELKILGKYRTFKEVRDDIGLALRKAYFFGMWREDDELIVQDIRFVDFEVSGNLRLFAEGVVVLPKEPTNSAGTISYHGYGRIEFKREGQDNYLLYDGRGGNETTNNSKYIIEAPEDGKIYGRQDGTWVEVTGGGIEEAPVDGKQYARKDAAWEEVSQGTLNHSGLNLDDGTNPHGTTQSDVGLGQVDNTSDADKPVSDATQSEIDILNNSVTNLSNNQDTDAITNFSSVLGNNTTEALNQLNSDVSNISDNLDTDAVVNFSVVLGNTTTEALNQLNSDKIGDAPSDGNQYARQDNGWSQVAAGGDAVLKTDNPTKTEKGAIKAFYDTATSTLEISIDGTDIV